MGSEVTCKKSMLEIDSVKRKLKIVRQWFEATLENRKSYNKNWIADCNFYLMANESQLHSLPDDNKHPIARRNVFLRPVFNHEIEYIGCGPSPSEGGEYTEIPYGSAAIITEVLKGSPSQSILYFNIHEDDIMATGEDLSHATDPYELVDHLVRLFERIDNSYRACTPWQYGFEKYQPFDCGLSGIPQRLRWMLRSGWTYVEKYHRLQFVIFDSQEFEDAFTAACLLPSKERMAIYAEAVEQYKKVRPSPRIISGNVPRDVFECLVNMWCNGDRTTARYMMRRTHFWSLHVLEWIQKCVKCSLSVDAVSALLSGLVYEYDHHKDNARIQAILAETKLPPCPDLVGLAMEGSLRTARAALRTGIVK